MIHATTPTGVGIVLDLSPSARGTYEIDAEERSANVLMGERYVRRVLQVARHVGPPRAQLGLFEPTPPAPPRRWALHGLTCAALERPARRKGARC